MMVGTLMSELKTRIISAAILAPVVLGIVWNGGIPFVLLMGVCFVLMLREWITITRSAPNRIVWAIWGAIYIGVPCAMLALFRVSTDGKWDEMVYLTIAVVWATDIGAYFVGRKFGKHKLAPKISPKKTWEGLIGGMVCAAVSGLLMFYVLIGGKNIAAGCRINCDSLLGFQWLPFMVLCVFLAVIAQIGDLYESWVKRKFGVKDSGNLIPGHGGLLDRMDGILSVAWAITILWAIVG